MLNPGRAGGVETQLPRIVADLWGQGAGLSAVLNQGRAGVTQSSIVHLRRFQQLNSLVYISCQPEDPRGLKNLQLLMQLRVNNQNLAQHHGLINTEMRAHLPPHPAPLLK